MSQMNHLNQLEMFHRRIRCRNCNSKRILWTVEIPSMNYTNSNNNTISNNNFTNIIIVNQTNNKTATTTTNNNIFDGSSSSTSNNNSVHNVTAVGYTMMILIVIVFLTAVFLTIYKLYKRRQIRIQFEQGYSPRKKATKIRIQRRYETIEHWIVTKRVLSHDDFCVKVGCNFSHHKLNPTKKHEHDLIDDTKNKPPNTKDTDVEVATCNNSDEIGTNIEQQILESENEIQRTKSDGDCQSISVASLNVSDVIVALKVAMPSLLDGDTAADNKVQSEDQKRLEHIAQIDLQCDTNNTCTEDDEDCDIIVSHDDIDEHECPVCMSPLQVDDVVSWSANTACTHVYHHECIKEWLLRHTECCLCKQIMLPVDEKRGKTAKQEALQELSTRYASASSTSYYCVQEGLVRIPKTVRCTRKELKQLEYKIFNGTVPPTELCALRGRQEELVTDNDSISVPVAPTLLNSTTIQSSRISDNTNHDHTSTGIETAVEGSTTDISASPTRDFRQQSNTSRFVSPTSSFAIDDNESPSSPIAAPEEQLPTLASDGAEGIETAIPSSSQQDTPVTPPRHKPTSIANGFCTVSPGSTSSSVASMTIFHNLDRVSVHAATRNVDDSTTVGSENDIDNKNNNNQNRHRTLTDYDYETYVSPTRSSLSESFEQDIECDQSQLSNCVLPSLSNHNDKNSIINTTNTNNNSSHERKVPSILYQYNTFAGRSRSTTTTSNVNNNHRGLNNVNQRCRRTRTSVSNCTTGATIHGSTNTNEEEFSQSENSNSNSSSTSSDGELVIATSLLEKRNVIGDNRCRIVETNENTHGQNEEGVEVHVTVSLPVYEE